jgi:hypothetical protein
MTCPLADLPPELGSVISLPLPRLLHRELQQDVQAPLP